MHGVKFYDSDPTALRDVRMSRDEAGRGQTGLDSFPSPCPSTPLLALFSFVDARSPDAGWRGGVDEEGAASMRDVGAGPAMGIGRAWDVGTGAAADWSPELDDTNLEFQSGMGQLGRLHAPPIPSSLDTSGGMAEGRRFACVTGGGLGRAKGTTIQDERVAAVQRGAEVQVCMYVHVCTYIHIVLYGRTGGNGDSGSRS